MIFGKLRYCSVRKGKLGLGCGVWAVLVCRAFLEEMRPRLLAEGRASMNEINTADQLAPSRWAYWASEQGKWFTAVSPKCQAEEVKGCFLLVFDYLRRETVSYKR